MSHHVGIALHRRRSRVALLGRDGVMVSSANVDDGKPAALVAIVSDGGEGCGVVLGGLALDR